MNTDRTSKEHNIRWTGKVIVNKKRAIENYGTKYVIKYNYNKALIFQ